MASRHDRYPFEEMISATYKLDQINEAMTAMANFEEVKAAINASLPAKTAFWRKEPRGLREEGADWSGRAGRHSGRQCGGLSGVEHLMDCTN